MVDEESLECDTCERGVPSSVLGRTRRILEAFDAEHSSLGLSELSRRAGLSKPTVHRLAAELTAWGVLEKTSSTYQLGISLFELGQRVPRQRALRDLALPFMEDLYVTTRETVHLAVPDDVEVMYLEKIGGHKQVASPSRIAGRMPMHCTATGKAMLAFGSEQLRRAVLDGPLQRVTRYTITTPQVLVKDMSQVKESGVAIEREETRLGYVSVAAPLMVRGEMVGAISVTGSVTERDPAILGPTVRTAAMALSRALTGATVRGHPSA